MTRRIHTSPGNGLLISKPGYDSLTAPLSGMLLTVSEKYSNLLKLGLVDATGSVALGFGVAPFVTITSIANLYGTAGVSWPPDAEGPTRPSPAWADWGAARDTYASVASDGSHMSIVMGSSYRVWYAVYSRIIA